MKQSQLPSDCGNYIDEEFEDIADDPKGKVKHWAAIIITVLGLMLIVAAICELLKFHQN